MPKPPWQEPLEQIGGHFILLGIAGAALLGPPWVMVIWVREFTTFRIWRWRIGQWPPGSPIFVEDTHAPGGEFVPAQWHTQLARVFDTRVDLRWTLGGIAVGLYAHPFVVRWVIGWMA